MAFRKAEMMETARKLVRESLELRVQGALGTRVARAQGYADGYMRLMLELDLVAARELLTLVGEERDRVEGPRTATLAVEALS
jgi:hypothetical protein